MGCDIHMYVEVKKDGQWQEVKNMWGTWKGFDGQIRYNRIYEERNYELFAILADVRNGFGFAGCDLGDKFIPISQPKGMPYDASKSVNELYKGWGIDAHSASYLTMQEILQFDWTQKNKLRGYVNIEKYKEWIAKGKGRPSRSCGDVGGRNIKKISQAEMDEIIKNPVPDISNYYCKVEWEETYEESAGNFISKTIPKLKELGNPENVRIVFWFDC